MLQAFAAVVASVAILGLVGSGGAESRRVPDKLFLEMIESQIPSDLKPIFDITYPDKSAFVACIRERQRLVKELVTTSEFSGGDANDEEPDDAQWARIVAEGIIASDPCLRFRVEQIIDLASLQEWAMGLAPEKHENGSNIIKWNEVVAPEGLKKLGGYIVLEEEPGQGARVVRIGLGGGFHHYGIVIGPPGYEPPQERSWRYYRWSDGVWGFQEN